MATTASSARTRTPASRCPTPRSASTAPAPTPAPSTTSPSSSTVRRATPATTTSPPRTTTCWSRESPDDQDGLGYFGFSYYAQNQDALNLVSVDDGKGCVAPSNGDDPVRRVHAPVTAAVHVPERGRDPKPEVEAFMQYVVDNYDTIAEQAQIVPMDSTQAAEAQLRLREGERLGGEPRGSAPRWKPEQERRAGAPGTPVLGAAPPPLGRGGDQGGPVRRRGDLGADHPGHRRLSAERDDQVLPGRRGRGVHHRRRLEAAVRRPAVRHLAADQRHPAGHRDRGPGGDPGRARLGDLPLRVRQPANPAR